MLREIARTGWEVAAPMRGVCVAWREALKDIPQPSPEEVLLPPHALALASLKERRWVDVSRDPNTRVFVNCTIPRDPIEYQRIGLQFFRPQCTKTLLRAVLCVSTERFNSLALTPAIRRAAYSLYDSLLVLKKVLLRCGGLWHLSARRQAALGKRTRLRCPLEMDADHEAAVKRLHSLLRRDPLLQPISKDSRARIMVEARRVRT